LIIFFSSSGKRETASNCSFKSMVKNVLDADGDLSQVKSKKNQNSGYFNYAKSFAYTAAGAVSSMQLGNGRWESTQFNSRLQPTQIALGTVQNGTDKLKLNYTYNTTGQNDNNGNVLSQTITVPTVGTNQGFTATQNYTYDSLNRLKSATETISTQTWKQTFLYDRYGNRNFDAANTTTLGTCATNVCNPTVNVSNNRFTTGQGYTYDLAGNLITDAQGRSFAYDAENKQKTVSNTGGTVGQYFYDGDGKRVKKVAGSETTIFVYDAMGKLVAEYSTQTASIPQVSYLTADHLGSPRITTDGNGNVISRRDFHPFGEEIYTAQRMQGLSYVADNVKQKFTAYERDGESGLDFAQARMYSNQLGRFTTTDPSNVSIEQTTPQTWNRYTYALNNPLQYVDKNGKWPTKTHIYFISEAFSGLTDGEINSIVEGSNSVDTYFRTGEMPDIPVTLIPSLAYRHAMTPEGKSQEEAVTLANQWIEDSLNDAIGFSELDLPNRSLGEFGKAAHTIMDNTSPAHTGFQEYSYPNIPVPHSGGINLAVFVMEGLDHKNQESRDPTKEETQKTVLGLRTHFLATYGKEAFLRAVPDQKDRDTVFKHMKDNNLTYTDGLPEKVNIINK